MQTHHVERKRKEFQVRKGTEVNLWKWGWSLSFNRITSSQYLCFFITLNQTWNEFSLVSASPPTTHPIHIGLTPGSSYTVQLAMPFIQIMSIMLLLMPLPSAWGPSIPLLLNTLCGPIQMPLLHKTLLTLSHHLQNYLFSEFPLPSGSTIALTTSGILVASTHQTWLYPEGST